MPHIFSNHVRRERNSKADPFVFRSRSAIGRNTAQTCSASEYSFSVSLMLMPVTYWSTSAGSSLPCKVVRVIDDVARCARMNQAQVHFLKGVSLIKQRNNFVGSPNCLAQISAR
jgi:hypothetical protein